MIAAEGEQKASRALRFNSLSSSFIFAFICFHPLSFFHFLFHSLSSCLKWDFCFIVFHPVSPYFCPVSSFMTVFHCVSLYFIVLYLVHCISLSLVREASEMIAESPNALQLRYLQVSISISFHPWHISSRKVSKYHISSLTISCCKV